MSKTQMPLYALELSQFWFFSVFNVFVEDVVWHRIVHNAWTVFYLFRFIVFVFILLFFSLQVCPENPRCLTRTRARACSTAAFLFRPLRMLYFCLHLWAAFCPPGGSKTLQWFQKRIKATTLKMHHWWHLVWHQQAHFCRFRVFI